MTGLGCTHAYEIFPRIAGRLAPVADGTFDGRWFQVSKAMSANAAASLASEGNPNSSEARMVSCRGSKFVGQHGEQSRIVGAAAGDNELAEILSAARQYEAAQGIGDRARRQRRGRGDDVLLCALVRNAS